MASVVASAAAAAGDTVDALVLHTCDVASLRRSGAAICLLMRIRDIYTRAGSAARERSRRYIDRSRDSGGAP